MKQFKKSTLDWWNDFMHRVKNKGEDTWSVTCKNNYLVVSKNDREVSKVGLDEVVSVTTYKKDLVTYDPVFLCFLDKYGCAIEVWEGMDGFDSFICNELGRYFDVEPDWFANVNKGAFAENRRVIWRL
ncbi:hypothetical protein [Gallaecimonas mangrovi]|uniref:hypothetical protein n=1 Tax=Gallaecimonas mangrovi TaxID=2291597 RepID=UPI000E2000CC|nr:hypothetical protein [Gallaecimonas mangrovi]